MQIQSNTHKSNNKMEVVHEEINVRLTDLKIK